MAACGGQYRRSLSLKGNASALCQCLVVVFHNKPNRQVLCGQGFIWYQSSLDSSPLNFFSSYCLCFEPQQLPGMAGALNLPWYPSSALSEAPPFPSWKMKILFKIFSWSYLQQIVLWIKLFLLPAKTSVHVVFSQGRRKSLLLSLSWSMIQFTKTKFIFF